MPLFTVIAELGGGTYVAQVRARVVGSALRKWATTLTRAAIPALTPSTHERLLLAVKSTAPVPLAECQGVWCFTAVLRGELLLANVVLTAEKLSA
jgi:hypothetical protein